MTRHYPAPHSATGALFTSGPHYELVIARLDLQSYFTRRDITRFFGARSVDELRQVLATVSTMTPAQLAAFKRELNNVVRGINEPRE